MITVTAVYTVNTARSVNTDREINYLAAAYCAVAPKASNGYTVTKQ